MTRLVCSECGEPARSGLNRGGRRYLLQPCGHVARVSEREPMTDDPKFRDAVTGEYVTAEYAAAHPDTTVAETDNDQDDTAEWEPFTDE